MPYSSTSQRKAYMIQWRAANPELVKDHARKVKAKCRAEVFAHYGGKCACCGEMQNEFLTLDHIKGGGNEHRREIGHGNSGGGFRFYTWLRQQGFPIGYRVLCWNCNCARGVFGYCPHERVV